MKALLLVPLLLTTFFGFSQDSKKDFSIGIGTGIDIISFRDISSSPLSYSGFGLPITLTTTFGSEKWVHQIDMSAISGALSNNYPLRSKANTELRTWDKGVLNYSLLHQLKESPNFIGGSFHTFIFYREFDFLDGQSYEFKSSLDMRYMRQLFAKDKYRITASISLPLLAYLHRKPSLTLDEPFLDDLYNGNTLLKYGKVRFNFHEWFGFRWNTLTTFQLNKKWFLTGEVGLEYYSISFPEKITNINYPITCSVSYQF